MNELFRKLAQKSSELVGSAWAFALALFVVIVWAVSGPYFEFSDTWQLVINTATTISTGLIVFLVQNTQNRDGKAIQLKLDELLRAQSGARTSLVDIEELSDEDLKLLEAEFKAIHNRTANQLIKALHIKINSERHRRSQ